MRPKAYHNLLPPISGKQIAISSRIKPVKVKGEKLSVKLPTLDPPGPTCTRHCYRSCRKERNGVESMGYVSQQNLPTEKRHQTPQSKGTYEVKPITVMDLFQAYYMKKSQNQNKISSYINDSDAFIPISKDRRKNGKNHTEKNNFPKHTEPQTSIFARPESSVRKSTDFAITASKINMLKVCKFDTDSNQRGFSRKCGVGTSTKGQIDDAEEHKIVDDAEKQRPLNLPTNVEENQTVSSFVETSPDIGPWHPRDRSVSAELDDPPHLKTLKNQDYDLGPRKRNCLSSERLKIEINLHKLFSYQTAREYDKKAKKTEKEREKRFLLDKTLAEQRVRQNADVVKNVVASDGIYKIFAADRRRKTNKAKAAATIQKVFRGWMVRWRVNQCRRKAESIPTTLLQYVQMIYYPHLKQLLASLGVQQPKVKLNFDELSEYMDERLLYEQELDIVVEEDVLSFCEVKTYVNLCRLSATTEDICSVLDMLGHPRNEEIPKRIALDMIFYLHLPGAIRFESRGSNLSYL